MKTITACRSCGSNQLAKMIDLGSQFTSDFRDDKKPTPAYPLQAVICRTCMLVQLRHTTPSEVMYHDNYGFKSGISDSIKADLKEVVSRGMEYKPRNWLDIASNDGTLLSYVPSDVYRVGVDPVKFLCDEALQHADWIINDYFSATDFDGKDKFDLITSISCFYDMADPNAFVADVKKVLADNGVWIIQQNYLLTTMQLGAVDNFCHEHIEYYTLLSLEPLLKRHGLEVFKVETSMVNGGSLRTYVAPIGTQEIDQSVTDTRVEEEEEGVGALRTYFMFAAEAQATLDALTTTVKRLFDEGNKIYILAASTRGSTIWQAANIQQYVTAAVERNPAKVGKYFSAIGVPIISEEQAHADNPGVMIIGPWFFAEEIIAREYEYLENGGMLLLPLPHVEEIRQA